MVMGSTLIKTMREAILNPFESDGYKRKVLYVIGSVARINFELLIPMMLGKQGLKKIILLR